MNNPAATRSRVQRNHALISPESHVASPLPGWAKTEGISLIGPPMGAHFVQYLALCETGATAGACAPGVSRFVYLLEGSGEIATDAESIKLEAGGFAYFPPGDRSELHVEMAARMLVIEKQYVVANGIEPPNLVTGQEEEIEATPFLGDPGALLKKLLPEEISYDFEINIFTFAPGASLPMAEVHIMEHGLLLLDGQGIYRLDEHWYPVQAGDVIWMGAFCLQWFVAIGKSPARYLYYKDVNRNYLGGST